jgi:hypothetical protein
MVGFDEKRVLQGNVLIALSSAHLFLLKIYRLHVRTLSRRIRMGSQRHPDNVSSKARALPPRFNAQSASMEQSIIRLPVSAVEVVSHAGTANISRFSLMNVHVPRRFISTTDTDRYTATGAVRYRI